MLFLLIAIAIFNKIIYRSYLNPIFLQSIVWLIYYIFLSININSYDVYIVNVENFLVLQSVGFSLGGFLCCLFTKSIVVKERQQISEEAINKTNHNVALLYPYMLIIIIGAIIFILKDVGSLSVFSIMDFRDALSEDDGKKVGAIGTVQLLISVYVIVYIGVLTKGKEKWYKPALLIFLFIYFTLLLGSKGQFVSFFCAAAYILVWQKKINKYYFGFAILSFLGILMLLFFLRAGGEKDSLNEDSVADLLLIYTVTALPALYLSKVAAPKIAGYYTFRVFYVWLNKLGFDFPVAPVLSEWVVTPLPTNVYSYIMPYYRDFGFVGVFFIPMFIGFFHNYIYFKANKGSLVFLILSSLFVYAILTQVWEENYFRQISNWAYITIVVLLITKAKLAPCKKETSLQTVV